MKISKKRVLFTFLDRFGKVDISSKELIKEQIREFADDNDDFENLVFELGVNTLAKSVGKYFE